MKPLGTCPECGRRIRIAFNGKLWPHKTTPWTERGGFGDTSCTGAGRRPTEAV